MWKIIWLAGLIGVKIVKMRLINRLKGTGGDVKIVKTRNINFKANNTKLIRNP
jgi:hypothetical protein